MELHFQTGTLPLLIAAVVAMLTRRLRLPYPRIKHKNPITGATVYDRRPIILGLKAIMTKKEAREKLYREIVKRKGGAKTSGLVLNDGSVSFGWFVGNRYLPVKDGDWSEETAKNKRSLIQSNLLNDLARYHLRI
ncbi:MAG: hypothetical protein WAM85_19480 [Terracidiphilus sp.]